MNLFFTFLKILLYIPLCLIFPAKVIDRKNLPKQRKAIVVSNHLSWLDVFLIALYVPRFRHFVGKKEIAKNPFVRLLLRSIGVIFIDREKTDMAAIRKIIKLLKKNHGINIFPEGTRNKVDESIQQVKSGVVMFGLKSDAPLIPVMIYKKTKPFRRNYMMAMPEISLEEFKGKPLSSIMDDATAHVEAELIAAKEKLNAFVENKRLEKQRRRESRRSKNKEKKA